MKRHYEFDDDELQAIDALLSLVHYDDLAAIWFISLPLAFRDDLREKVWLDEAKESSNNSPVGFEGDKDGIDNYLW